LTIKDLIAKIRIPKNTCYCYTPKRPLKNKPGYRVKPCPYFKFKYNEEWGEKAEYCTYLKDFLTIQDSVKDCGINDYEFDEEDMK
jgi:hypothetical protein